MKFSIEVNEQTLNIILAGLAKLPYEQSAELIAIIQAEYRKQVEQQKAQLETKED